MKLYICNLISYFEIRKYYVYIYSEFQCDNLSTPVNGSIKCNYSEEGVIYKGDFCRFYCNKGYDLIGSDIRFCMSTGNWNGTKTMCIKGMLIIIMLN